jgi:hypothetical protein
MTYSLPILHKDIDLYIATEYVDMLIIIRLLDCYLYCPHVRQAIDPQTIHNCTIILSVCESRNIGTNLSFALLSCQFHGAGTLLRT